ncbi:hypothetical protein HMPREF9565_00216 [Cutibacterium acnes HL053PA2]|nr:hypothetical protein HMPREF9575_00266 [Cutibacterium acnes HL110PA1]EFS49283.1 hypothetical protein HMPREF9585_00584 [Cutibacterium acnes HL083PA1]EFS51086.1 hypothetical protein HMPREF9587_01180 [Cutibacterium acnes HL025PA1]EFS57245.1 hypothetical protein HMPREF9593_00129 [Cutibacterium acnes HL046PA2]EFS67338.1 hypothetical protein HMPREF9612_00324 [Cutibacterium acnes HL063PA2]EFS69023.1 hypothetical protein HMPREF9616_01230 [Cutibacterium acnes HL007PA1]EFS77635.1 hypothetical protein
MCRSRSRAEETRQRKMFKGARRGMESLRYPAQRRTDGSDDED